MSLHLKLRKFSKITGIVVLILAALLTAFHFWFIHRSVKLLEDFVYEQSKGKYQLKIRKLRYNYAKLIFQLDEPSLTCLDTTTTQDKYDASAHQITINLKQLLPLIFKKELRFDSLSITQPNIRITHQKFKDSTAPDKEVNISQDMFNAYASLRNVLGQLQLDKFSLKGGTFSIFNTRKENAQPLNISGIDFTVTGLNINKEDKPVYDPLAVTDSIGLNIAGQKIVFPDGKKSIAFKNFRLNSVTGSITLDSFQVMSRSDTSANNFNVFADKLSLKKFRLVNRNGADYTQIDSVFFTRPVAKLVLETDKKQKDSTQSVATTLQKVVETVTGNGLINYIGINNVAFDITALKNDKESHFAFLQDKLEIGNVLLNKDSIQPISIGSLRFGLKRYVNYFSDSTYLMQFDSIRILDGQLALYDFELRSTPKAPQLQNIHIPVLLLNGIDWFRLIIANQFAAKSVALFNPQIVVSAPAKQGGKGKGLQKLADMFAVDHLLLQNANVKVLFSKNEYAQVRRLTIDAQPDKFLLAPSATSMLAMLHGVTVQDVTLVKSGWNASASDIRISDTGGVRLPFFSVVNRQKNIRAKGENLRITSLQVDEATNHISVGTISWKSILAEVILPEKKENNTAGKQPDISVASINGGPVKLHVSNSKLNVTTDLAGVQSGPIAFAAGKLDTLKDFAIKGNMWQVLTSELNAVGGNFMIAQQKASVFTAIKVNINQPIQQITATIPEITFAGDLAKMAENQVVLDYLKINRPLIRMVVPDPKPAVQQNAQTTSTKAFPYIRLQRFEIDKPDFSFLKVSKKDTIQMHLSDAYFATTIASGKSELALQQTVFKAATFKFNKKDSVLAGITNGNINLTVAGFSFYKNTTNQWKFSDAGISLSKAQLTNLRDSGRVDTIAVPSFTAAHFSASQNETQNWKALVFNQPQLQLQNVTLRYHNTDNIFEVEDLNTVLGTNRISMASFLYRPQLAEEAFIKAHYYETDFIRTKTGRLIIHDFNRQRFIRDSAIDIRHISIDDVDFRDTRDKTPPFKANVIKPLPITLINRIPFPLAIDSLTLQNANISYKEVSEKTGQPGTVTFSHVQSEFLNLRNRNQTARDTFQWNSHAMMMDSMPFFLGIKAAYKDSLDKLVLTVRISPTSITYLNPFFAPLEGISFKEGKIKSLEMVATANDYIGHGYMKFYYDDLQIHFLNPHDTTKQGFLKSVITFLANKLILKHHNDYRTGTVYFERIRDRSIFNYIVKLTISGMKSSIGAAKNKKLEKAYAAKLEEEHWQPLEEQ